MYNDELYSDSYDTLCRQGKWREKVATHFSDSLSIIHHAEIHNPSAPDGDGTCFVHTPSTYEGKRPSATDGNETCFVQIPSTYEGERPSAMDGNRTCFVQIPSTYEDEIPSATDGDETCFVQIPSIYEGERPSAVDSRRVWPIDLVDRVRSILQLPVRQPTKPEFSFELSMESAEKIFLILTKKYSGSLEAALEGQHESPLGMGSEFRPIEVLETIYGNHPIWGRMVPILQQGSTWPLEETCLKQSSSAITRERNRTQRPY